MADAQAASQAAQNALTYAENDIRDYQNRQHGNGSGSGGTGSFIAGMVVNEILNGGHRGYGGGFGGGFGGVASLVGAALAEVVVGLLAGSFRGYLVKIEFPVSYLIHRRKLHSPLIRGYGINTFCQRSRNKPLIVCNESCIYHLSRSSLASICTTITF